MGCLAMAKAPFVINVLFVTGVGKGDSFVLI